MEIIKIIVMLLFTASVIGVTVVIARERALSPSKGEFRRLALRLDAAEKSLTGMAGRVASLTEGRQERGALSIPRLRARHGHTGMARLYDKQGRLVASLSEAFLHANAGIPSEELGAYDIEIILRKQRKTKSNE